jgi:hypothetical protein
MLIIRFKIYVFYYEIYLDFYRTKDSFNEDIDLDYYNLFKGLL